MNGYMPKSPYGVAGRPPYGGITQSGTPSLGTVTILDLAEADPNQSITIPSATDGPVTYELLDGGLPTPGMVPVDISAAANEAAAANLLRSAIAVNQPGLGIVAAGAVTDLTYDSAQGQEPAIVYSGPARFASVAGFAGGEAPTRTEFTPIRWGLSRGVCVVPALRPGPS